MATCLELAGIQAEHTHFARSLVPQLRGRPGDPARSAFCEAGFNSYEPQCFDPMSQYGNKTNIYYPKTALEHERPQTVSRCAMIRTAEHKLVWRPDGQGELYDMKRDPQELHNVFGDKSYAGAQSVLQARMLDWYVRTSDVAPRQHDPRGFPTQG
jgi:choline-sulfatase